MNKKIFVILAEGFELIEAMTPVDVLRRAGLEVTTLSITSDLTVNSAQNVKILADNTIDNVNLLDADMIVLPGGYPGFINLRENKKIVETVEYYLNTGKYVAAICGAPTLLGMHNLIKDYNFTCHSSVINDMNSQNYLKNDIVIDRNLITSCGAGKSLDFSLVLASKFVSEEQLLKVKLGMELI